MLTTSRAAEVTRKKLAGLEKVIAQTEHDNSGNPRGRELTIQSLKRLANQLREELLLFEARSNTRVAAS